MQKRIGKSAFMVLLGLASLTLFGCASLPPGTKRDPRDPWERMNRATYQFNDKFDKGLARPLARTYKRATPDFVQTGVSNFIDNLEYPITIVNDLLQAQFVPFAKDTGRLVMNTTLGIGGLFDPASSAGLEKNPRDFGQTLGKWGVPAGPYLVVPFLGPFDVRDAVGYVGDEFTNPRHYIDNNYVSYSLFALRAVEVRASLLPATAALDQAYDPYAFLRNAYLSRRQYLVTGETGAANEEAEEEKMLEESGVEDEQTPPNQPQAQPKGQGQQPEGTPPKPEDQAQPKDQPTQPQPDAAAPK